MNRKGAVVLTIAAAMGLVGCPNAPKTPTANGRAPAAQKWLDRARASYASGDVDDAWDSATSASRAAPGDEEVAMWAARVSLAKLDFAETVRILQGVSGSEARGLRGRAKWYAGDVESAADELEAMLQDPEVRDPWAKAVAGLARRGTGRKPFRTSGALVGVSEMARLPEGGAMIVPVEIDGEESLAMIATSSAEVTLDSATRKEPSWISLRFGGKIEVKDVPAMVQDLSGLSRRLNAPIKAMLGINLLRHLNATFDYSGGQFVVRNFAAPTPEHAARVPVYYVKGGGMVVKGALDASKNPAPALLLVDTSAPYRIALDQDGWKKAGVTVASLQPMPQDPATKQGVVPVVRLGSFDVSQVPGVFGAPITDMEKGLQIDLDGVLGAGLLGAYRLTLADEGRTLWVEDMPSNPVDSTPAAPAAGAPAPATRAPALTAPTLVAPAATAAASAPPATRAPAAPAKPRPKSTRGGAGAAAD